MYEKIPNTKDLNIYKDSNFINSSLIEIPNDCGIIIEMKYPLLGMKNSISKCLVRKEVLDKLLEAKNYLPDNITFKIWDAYRPLSLQEEIYYKYKNMIIKQFNLESLNKNEQNKFISNFVSLPSKDMNIPPLHATGGSIDLTLAYKDTKKELNMGVNFDEFSNLTMTNYYEENDINEIVKKNRRILYWSMIKAGFTNLPTEIWHYDYGNRAWAFYKERKAIYKGISNINEKDY